MSQFLNSIGATPRVRASFEVFAARGLTLARVSRVNRGACEILAGNGEELRAEPTGALLYRASTALELPAVGDWVAAQIFGEDAVVHAVLPRLTAFARRAAGTREEQQILAANMDTVFVVCGLDHDFNPRRLERYLTLTRESGAAPVIVLNKADLCPDIASRTRETVWIASGVPVAVIQANRLGGIAPLAPHIAEGRTIALLGSSGAGKSTLINQLLGISLQRTGDVCGREGRGRHTTTSRQLVPLPQGGALIDTPGLRELQLWAGQESLDETFAEIAAAALHCRFRDCTHSGEPGCAVEAALSDGAIDPARWQSYRKLTREIRHHEIASDQLAARAQKQRWKTIHKAMRKSHKEKN